MESDHTIRLGLELGFQDHLMSSSSRLEQKKNPSILDDHQQHTPFSFLSLALSEPKPRSEDEGDDQTTGNNQRIFFFILTYTYMDIESMFTLLEIKKSGLDYFFCHEVQSFDGVFLDLVSRAFTN